MTLKGLIFQMIIKELKTYIFSFTISAFVARNCLIKAEYLLTKRSKRNYLKDIPYRLDIYELLNRTSSRIVRVAAASGLAQEF